MTLDSLIQTITNSSQELIQALKEGNNTPPLGLRRSARLPLLAVLYQELRLPLLLLTDRTDRALMLADELSSWIPSAAHMLFPEPTPLFYENAAWGANTRRDRLAVLTSLAAYHIPGASLTSQPPLIIAPARAVMTRTLPRRDFLKALRSLKPGQVTQPDELVRAWDALGYEIANIVVSPGQFARRGGILDIWPAADEQPVRIEFFGDEIDTLRRFDPATQRTIESIEHLTITPAREYLTTATGSELSSQSLNSNQQSTLSEFDIPLLHPTPASLLDYLPRHSLTLLDDISAVRDTVQEVEEQAAGLRRDYVQDGELPEDFPVPYLSWSEIEDTPAGKQVLDLGYTGDLDQESTLSGINERFTSGPRFGGRLKPAMEHLAALTGRGETVLVISRQTSRLQELWAEQSPTAEATSQLYFIDGSLSEGFTYTPPGTAPWHLLTDGELFGWRRPELRPRHRPSAEAPEAAYADLQAGDWVVHVDHGIGRFTGLVERAVDGMQREYLCVEYAEGDQLFVPVYQADRLTRYIGTDANPPAYSRLGGVEWKNTKGRVKEAVVEVAQDLLELYARRNIVKGHAFAADTPWQQELEVSFPYVETDDQMRVITEVKNVENQTWTV
jgi:transcription-repair coupling factor (superfamily II helicase)